MYIIQYKWAYVCVSIHTYIHTSIYKHKFIYSYTYDYVHDTCFDTHVCAIKHKNNACMQTHTHSINATSLMHAYMYVFLSASPYTQRLLV